MNDIQSKVDNINFVHSCANKWIPILSEYFLTNYNGKKIAKNDKYEFYTEVYKNMPEPFFYDRKRMELDRYNNDYNLVIAEETQGNIHVKLIHMTRKCSVTFQIFSVGYPYRIRFIIGDNRRTSRTDLLFNHSTEKKYSDDYDKFVYVNLSQLPLRTDYTVSLVQRMHDEAFECIKNINDNVKIHNSHLKELYDQYLAAKEVLKEKFIDNAESVQNMEKLASLVSALDTKFVREEFLPKERPLHWIGKQF